VNRTMASDRKIHTFAEVANHNKTKDCWLVISGKVCFFFLLKNFRFASIIDSLGETTTGLVYAFWGLR